MDIVWLALLRLVHVTAASIWFGTVVFGAFFLGPSVQAAGEHGRGFMAAVEERGGVGRFMGPIALAALASGIALYALAGYVRAPFATPATTLLTLGGLLAIAAWIVGVIANARRWIPGRKLVGVGVVGAFLLMAGRFVLA